MANKNTTPMAKAEVARIERERHVAEVERLATVVCRREHKTWASKAACLWPKARIEGEGPIAVLHESGLVTLHGPGDALPVDSPGDMVTRLHRGIHRKGGGDRA